MKRGVCLIRGIYIAASGMLVESLRADVTANNLANANTAGFKKDFAVIKDYASRQIRRIHDGAIEPEIGVMGAGAWIDTIATHHSGGIMRVTNNTLDVAIEGKGFFICFVTNKLDVMHELAQAKGLNPSDIRNPDPESRYFYVYDPNGVSIQLRQN